MADRAFFIGWGNPVRGREKVALQVFNESVQYWAQLQQTGQIESFEVAMMEPHGGDLAGFAILRGSGAQLNALRPSAEFQKNVTRANLIVENLGVVGAVIGEGLTNDMAVYAEQIAELT